MQEDLRRELMELADRVLEDLGLELVELEIESTRNRRLLRFFVDRPEPGVTVQECATASRAIGFELEGLDLISGAYVLEVSSPGLNRRVARARDFMRYTGRKIKVKTRSEREGRRNYTGVLAEATENDIMVKTEDDEIRFDIQDIVRANLIYDFEKKE